MGHTPFGYRIENGKAVIDEAAASQVRNLYNNNSDYLQKARKYGHFTGYKN